MISELYVALLPMKVTGNQYYDSITDDMGFHSACMGIFFPAT